MAETQQRLKERPKFEAFNPPKRLLLGPGPSPVDSQVLAAMTAPVLGHLDPVFLQCMDDIKVMLRYAFQTDNSMTIPISGTGSAGMEAALVNLIEPEDEAVICISGYFGERIREMAERCGARVIQVQQEWGTPVDRARIEEALNSGNPKVVAIVMAETSTGVWQDITGLADLVHSKGAVLVVDAVTALGTQPVRVDADGIDVCFSCTQKGIGAPPGLAPITFSERAMKKITSRRTKVRSWYLDVTTIQQYWGSDRAYHHTAPISMNYALREALRLLCDEGLEDRWRRHQTNSRAFVAGIEAMGLKMLVAPDSRLWGVNVVCIPDGVDDAQVRAHLLSQADIEISGGLGPFKGKVWRIGLMGAGSKSENARLLLAELNKALAAQGVNCPSGLEAFDSALQ